VRYYNYYFANFDRVILNQPTWIRFGIAANIIGGELKTVPDQESLRADWFPLEDLHSGKVKLRTKDILPLIFDVFLKNKYIIPINFFLDKTDSYMEQNSYLKLASDTTTNSKDAEEQLDKLLDNV